MVKIEKIIVISLIGLVIVFIAHNLWQNSQTETNSNISLFNTAIQVDNQSGEIFGNILLSTDNDLSLEYAKVLINGIPRTDFSDGEVLIRVYPGDIVSIDGSAYQRELSFALEAISSNIDSTYLKTTINTKGNSVDAGIIVFK